ncbi:PhzF family phenazine biosynthesis protein [Nocardioides aurantiacus]|uniref:PhzF family phenazine biosynthesis protein n=1 Tax=Nocardioides aurantiacus TaxID=86796 RepID=A0A3N2CWN4_9ACTN|nr:PhzF family phenazine biosynthesis protein [Nocardioides aurantiacus]ROR91604.1 PhzF family phenazine biosynthesis protein [Nocardioides aurantiacus]
MTSLPVSWVDVFADGPLSGNPVAVVHGAEGLDDATLAAFARWTNLSETTFLLPPREAGADYRVRIFTPAEELPFAGHPTLGTAHAWLEGGGVPAREDVVVQECGLGLVEVRASPGSDRRAFRAPGFLRSGPVDAATLERAVAALRVEPDRVLRAAWIDNGPGWLGLQLRDARTVLDLAPDLAAMQGLELGVIGAHDAAEAARLGAAYEVRAFCPGLSVPEDPVTGSLNAGFAVWLVGEGVLPASYVVRQGTAVGRDGRVHVERDDDGALWVGGATRTVVAGHLTP